VYLLFAENIRRGERKRRERGRDKDREGER
jgi:hypothetical protein